MSNMPFSDKPTMVMGIDMYQKITSKKKSFVTALLGTFDRHFTKYHTECNMQSDILEAHLSVRGMAIQAFQRFKKQNGRYPDQVIVYREGTSEGQNKNILDLEIKGSDDRMQGLKLAMQELNMLDSRLVVMAVNKKVNAKIFLGDSMKLNNPLPGTLLANDIVDQDSFLLISQKSPQGISAPVKYSILYNDFPHPQVKELLY